MTVKWYQKVLMVKRLSLPERTFHLALTARNTIDCKSPRNRVELTEGADLTFLSEQSERSAGLVDSKTRNLLLAQLATRRIAGEICRRQNLPFRVLSISGWSEDA